MGFKTTFKAGYVKRILPVQLLWMMFLVALLPKIANEQLQEWKLKLVTDLGPLEGASPVYRFCEMTILLYMLRE